MSAVPTQLPTPAPLHLTALRELWVHTGTACNLSCPFCHEGSKPGDRRIEAPTLAQLEPHLQGAAHAGVERFIFTGGEPLILREIGRILHFALQLRPCLVLTNGTAPLIRRSQQLELLRAQPHPLAFRVSIDYADEARHDAQRGLRNFRKALQGLRLLHDAGFEVSVTRQVLPGETAAQAAGIATRYRALLQRHGVPPDLAVFALPELGPPGTAGFTLVPQLADARRGCSTPPLCTSGRMLRIEGAALAYAACVLVDDDPRFVLGRDLPSAALQAVDPSHPRCAVCRRQAVNYGGICGQ